MTEPDKKRSVRSFVRRSGRMTAGQERALAELWPQFGISIDEPPLDFTELFGRDAPVVIEIGFGNGESLVQLAAEQPGNNFIGIEVHEPGIGHCLLALEEAGLRNLRVVSHDALEVLQRTPDAALSRINLYFPDPWPKKRHHKRRIVNEAFLALCHSKLAAGGHLHIATDWANYAEHIDEMLSAATGFAVEQRREHCGDQPLERPTTKFERRGLKKGHKIFDWKVLRV